MRPRRSVLYMPAANTRAMDKARDLDCDAIIFDLEDAVAVSNIFVNTNAAAAAGVLAMAIVSFARSGKMDLPLMQ